MAVAKSPSHSLTGSVLIWFLVLGFVIGFGGADFFPTATASRYRSFTSSAPGLPDAGNSGFPVNLGKVAVFYTSAKMDKRFTVDNAVDFKLSHFQSLQPLIGGSTGSDYRGKIIAWDTVRRNDFIGRIGKLYLKRLLANKRIRGAIERHRVVDQLCRSFRCVNKLEWLEFHPDARSFLVDLSFHQCGLVLEAPQCSAQKPYLQEADDYQQSTKSPYAPIGPVLRYRHGGKFADSYGMLSIFAALLIAIALGWPVGWCFDRRHTVMGWCLIALAIILDVGGCVSGIVGCLPWNWWACLHDGQEHSQSEYFHGGKSVTQKHLTTFSLCNTVNDMANVLSTEKQTAIISVLAEGSSIRSIERITGVHRDTIMRLGVKVGKGCAMLMDSKMQDLDCNYLQLDEVWGFIGKKERHCSVDDNPEYGDVWTFCAIDSETKLVPSFKCGKRNHETANAFVQDIANRVRNRVQISTDALGAYGEAVERAFGADVDYGQIVKVYTHDAAQHPERKYSAPHFASAYRRPIAGNPEREFISTSHVERLNATTRLHVKRLSRLTLAFSKKFENFQAAVALHFAYYNFVRRHNTLRCTPAMAAGIERDFWSIGDLVEATV